MEGRQTFDVPVTGLASLTAFEIPTRGRAFHFKTIGGSIEIEARHVEQSLADRGGRLGWLAGSLIALLLLVQVGGRLARHRVVGSVMAALLFFLSGLIIVGSVFPIVGCLLMVVSIAWVCWIFFGPDRAVTSEVSN